MLSEGDVAGPQRGRRVILKAFGASSLGYKEGRPLQSLARPAWAPVHQTEKRCMTENDTQDNNIVLFSLYWLKEK